MTKPLFPDRPIPPPGWWAKDWVVAPCNVLSYERRLKNAKIRFFKWKNRYYFKTYDMYVRGLELH